MKWNLKKQKWNEINVLKFRSRTLTGTRLLSITLSPAEAWPNWLQLFSPQLNTQFLKTKSKKEFLPVEQSILLINVNTVRLIISITNTIIHTFSISGILCVYIKLAKYAPQTIEFKRKNLLYKKSKSKHMFEKSNQAQYNKEDSAFSFKKSSYKEMWVIDLAFPF